MDGESSDYDVTIMCRVLQSNSCHSPAIRLRKFTFPIYVANWLIYVQERMGGCDAYFVYYIATVYCVCTGLEVIHYVLNDH